MISRRLLNHIVVIFRLMVFLVSASLLTFACVGPATPTSPPIRVIPITPMCTLLCGVGGRFQLPQVMVSDRIDPAVDNGFTPFRKLSGLLGNPAILPPPRIYAASEIWLRRPLAAVVFRAQATGPNPSPAGLVNSWNITAENATGVWTTPNDFEPHAFGFTGGNAESDEKSVVESMPRLMSVGEAMPQVFGCAGDRTEDGKDWTTWLVEAIAASPDGSTRWQIKYIQDLLNGDDRFVPNKNAGGLIGPTSPPTPTISGPGDPIRSGSVLCAMVQQQDDLTTRELHMIAINGGRLYHSMAFDFGPVTREDGSILNRFRKVSAWGDVGEVLGGGFGNITSVAIVAHPRAVSVFFMAENAGRYRLWHTVRFSPAGNWRFPKDVFALTGDFANGTTDAWQISAGSCPALGAGVWNESTTETLVALWGGNPANPLEVKVIREVATARQWRPGVFGYYSPWSSIQGNITGDIVPNKFMVKNIVIAARPFRDDATPPP
jgi:hypothetical protein